MPAIQPDDPRLQKFCLFAGLGGEELVALLQLTDAMTCPAGSRIVRAGESGHCLYVLLEGRAKVTVDADGREIELSSLEPGDFFGEVTLVDDGPRSANVIALEACVLLRITRMTIGVLSGLHPAAAIQILGAIGRALVGRLRASNQKYIDILLRTGGQE
ncbi:MAG: cyclic nucleotide-binding domain-containing protein [Terrimicrobiaceae bacterium]|nr:cyclic nucleotide-binding domain-containing protein [Terrimicrobiaceae bacterium]